MREDRSGTWVAAETYPVATQNVGTSLIIRNDNLAVIPPRRVPLYLKPRRAIGRLALYASLASVFCVMGYAYRDPVVRKAVDYRMTLALSSGISSSPNVNAGKIAPPHALPSHAAYLFIDGQKGPRADRFLYVSKDYARQDAPRLGTAASRDESNGLGVARRTKSASLNARSQNAPPENSNAANATLAGATLFLTAFTKTHDAVPFAESGFAATATSDGPSEWSSLLRNASLTPDQPQSGTLFGGLTEDEFRLRELRCMATAIYFEARDEPVRGQIAVAQVVMNRVRSQFYPKTICGVIYQGERLRTGCQFSFTCTGKKLRVKEKPEWANSVKVAKQVIAREVWIDDIGHATHYHATYVKPVWRHDLDRVAKIGEHIFYKMKPGTIQVALLAEGL